MQIQLVHSDIGIVSHTAGYHVALGIDGYTSQPFHLNAAFPITQSQIGIIVSTIGLDSTIKGHSVRYAVVLCKLRIHQGRYKVHILCLGTELDVGLHLLQVCHVTNRTIGSHLEGRWQIHY